MKALSRFGLLLISGSAFGILVLKGLVKYHLFMNTWLYTDLSSLAIMFGFIVAIAVILLLNPFLKNLLILLVVFVLTLVLVYIFIVPVYLEGV